MADILWSEVYIDYCLAGALTLGRPKEFSYEHCELLKGGGLTLRKSNRSELLDTMPRDYLEILLMYYVLIHYVLMYLSQHFFDFHLCRSKKSHDHGKIKSGNDEVIQK